MSVMLPLSAQWVCMGSVFRTPLRLPLKGLHILLRLSLSSTALLFHTRGWMDVPSYLTLMLQMLLFHSITKQFLNSYL